MKQFFYHVREFFYQLLRIDFIRFLVAAIRYIFYAVLLRRMKTYDPGTGNIGVNTVLHNKLRVIKGLGVNRSSLLLYPLFAIRLTKSDPVLCIGPRAEGEILNLMGLGFHNIKALDLISYSPWIELGDMHAMPYKDNEFRAVIMGWCIAYSDNRRKAAEEAVRVTKNGGIIAVGVQHVSKTPEELSQEVGYQVPDQERVKSVAEILELFGDSVDRVFFQQDLPDHPTDKWEILVHFSVKK